MFYFGICLLKALGLFQLGYKQCFHHPCTHLCVDAFTSVG